MSVCGKLCFPICFSYKEIGFITLFMCLISILDTKILWIYLKYVQPNKIKRVFAFALKQLNSGKVFQMISDVHLTSNEFKGLEIETMSKEK
jgi:hypothetical protein